ncbi:MAG: GGDEF domain-containing protein [Bryobacteraceae bacterium]|jgi:diguanylate cyclase (GGDEF)-like protein
MISLKKHIDEYDRQLADALLSACRATLLAAGKSGGQAVPDLAASLRDGMNSLHDRLSALVTPAEVAHIEEDIEATLATWGKDAVQSSLDNLNRVREVMMALAASAAAIADRDHRYTDRFKQLTERLQSAAKVHDIGTMRRSVIDSASEIKACVEQMATEGDRSLSELRAQIAHYRSELKEYQKRDSIDSLTGLANRQTIEAQIQDHMSWSSKFCLAIMDLNGFKQINDTWGHAAGDDLLKQFGAEVQSRLRSTDLVGRWGGDEFVLIIGSPIEEATRSMDRLRDWAFGEYEITNGAATMRIVVTAATGIAEWDGKESLLDLFNRADRLMYSDKKTIPISHQPGCVRKMYSGRSVSAVAAGAG